jgi:Zn-dependent peptidase ImmA (M78 family)
MTPARPRYSRINRAVVDLLAKAQVTMPPVPIDKIAKAAGAKITFNDFNKEVSGVLLRQGNSIIIGVASEQSRARQRFTIAHELAHLVLHEGEELHVDKSFRINLRSPISSKAEDVQEIEANAFAAALLMPDEFIRRDTVKMIIDVEDSDQIEKLARRYEVSTQAMTFRLMNLLGTARRP